MESLCKTYAESYIWRMKFMAKCLKEDQKNRELFMSNLCNQVPPEMVIDSLKNELVQTLLREREEIAEWCEENEDPKEYFLPSILREMRCFIEKYEEFETARERISRITERLNQLGVKDE